MQVLNRHNLDGWPKGARYIGRGTPFGNPFAIGEDGDRDTVIRKFRDWLIREIDDGNPRILEAMRGLREDTPLVCSCAPRPCHGEVVRELWEARFRTERPLVFVFGSNLAGRHGKGAAKYAREVFGAVPGKGEGAQGSAYAIPTKNAQLKTLPPDQITLHVRRFFEHARKHPDTDFRVTPIGTGLAGYAHDDIAPMFRFAPRNCLLPEEWSGWIDDDLRDRVVRLLVAGSRDFTDYDFLQERLNHFTGRIDPGDLCLISGTARGADEMGERWAKRYGIPVVPFPARCDALGGPHAAVRQRNGRSYDAMAGHKRNAQMAACATHAVLFWNGESRGTANMLDLCREHGITTRVVKTAQPDVSPAPGMV